MKTTYALFSAVLIIVLTPPVFGQQNLADTAKTGMEKHDMSSMMGKPTVDATVDGLHMKVWLMTQAQHKEMMKGRMGGMMMHREKEGAVEKMEMRGMNDTSMGMGNEMKGMKHGGMGMNKAMMDSMMAGTHHIRLDVSYDSLGEDIANASARILIVSPSKKTSSVDLKAMMSHFGGALTLDETGEYQFTVSVNINGVSRTKQFEYTVE